MARTGMQLSCRTPEQLGQKHSHNLIVPLSIGRLSFHGRLNRMGVNEYSSRDTYRF
jgi:hypothetical protein